MTRKAAVLLGTILVALGAMALFQLKYTIEAKERLIAELNTQYLVDERAIRVLRAEWSYLNSPDMLQESAARHLDVEPLTADRILKTLNAIPLREDASEGLQPIFNDPGFMPRRRPIRQADVSLLPTSFSAPANDAREDE